MIRLYGHENPSYKIKVNSEHWLKIITIYMTFQTVLAITLRKSMFDTLIYMEYLNIIVELEYLFPILEIYKFSPIGIQPAFIFPR